MVNEHKTFLENQKRKSRATGDFIPAKGNGLVILLSGPSGLGKTMTAGTASRANLNVLKVNKAFVTLSRMSPELYQEAIIQNQSREVL
jgi:SpoVK/Ycf46/Vps4 family AAA+-type ATPase